MEERRASLRPSLSFSPESTGTCRRVGVQSMDAGAIWVQIPALPFQSSVTRNKLFHFSVPQSSHL